ncbi:MAG: hypothetical protein IJ176_05865 [Prevotella sp.]|nr:hypothetical protein [Prevotella sp.]
MERRNSHHFTIADHTVCLRFADSEANSMQLLPSFAAFTTTPSKDDAMVPFFTLTVDDSLRPARKDDKQLVRKFDTGNGDTLVYLLNDGGYQYIIRDVYDRDCCLLITNKDFTVCRCALNGDWTMRSFGLNDALMLIYAFRGAFCQTLLIHASTIRLGDYGYPFTAKSGTGKSTHSALWMKHIEGAELMNDDNPIIRLIDRQPFIYGSPWSGKTPCYRNIRARLGAVTLIDRAPQNSIERLAPVQAFATLLPACSSMKWDATIYNHLCDAVTRIVETTPIYTLHCLPDEEAARLCHKTLTADKG